MAITNIPIAEEVISFSNKYEMNPEELSVFESEEYELVVTIRPESWVQANDIVIACGGRLIPIGKVIKESKVTLTTNHVVRDIPVRGWEHFKGS